MVKNQPQNPEPTTADAKVSKGAGTGNFSATLTGLTQNTHYYARPYAIANGKTCYGEVKGVKTLQEEVGVVINGVRWATRNVDMPGTFTATPVGAGMFYQWGSNVGWSITNPLTASDGINIWRDLSDPGNVWLQANDPCPAGWRVPTVAELHSLLENSVKGELTNEYGHYGYRFTDITTGYSIFLIMAGCRRYYDGSFGSYANYWSNTVYNN